jgi:hypothetical protein
MPQPEKADGGKYKGRDSTSLLQRFHTQIAIGNLHGFISWAL